MKEMDAKQYIEERRQVIGRLKEVIVEQLALEIEPEFIANDQPLFGRGLELDSIDALELSVGVFTEFSVTISDDETYVFDSVNRLADYIMENRDEE